MLEQKEELKPKRYRVRKIKKLTKLQQFLQQKGRFEKILCHRNYQLRPVFQHILNSSANKKLRPKYGLHIRIRANNVFCTLRYIPSNRIMLAHSSGKYRIKVSKKSLKFQNRIIVGKFLKRIKKWLKRKFILVLISGPVRIKTSILRQVRRNLKRSEVLIKTLERKCFNGCRPPKKRRKKRKGFRIFK